MNKIWLLVVLILLAGCRPVEMPDKYSDYSYRYSEGICIQDADCNEFGCICSGYESGGNCTLPEDHPKNDGYECGCVDQKQKCGWYA